MKDGGENMGKGISIFLGMNYSLKENKNYIMKAKKEGFSSVFTSLHIPEADYENAINEFREIAELSKSLDMNIIADISPRAFEYLHSDMNNLGAIKELGVYGIRVDFGFSAEEIASFTKNPYGLMIEINASTVTKKFLEELHSFNPEYSRLQACHNYYPRLNTGISVDTMLKKNIMLKNRGMKVSAFIPSLVNKRGPIYEGLPTLERHRFLKPEISTKHLYALGLDDVIFGDSIPSTEEIEAVGRVNEKALQLSIELLNPSELENKIIFEHIHENRPDSAEDVVRSTSSRLVLKGNNSIIPHDNIARTKGCVTIDNSKYLRYCGELQVCKRDLEPDNRVNVVGKVVDEELFLIDFIEDESRFEFINYKY